MTPIKRKYLRLLETKGSLSLSDFRALLPNPPTSNTVKVQIHALRKLGFKIDAQQERVPTTYKLVGGPNSLAQGLYVCPDCSGTINLMAPEHLPECPIREAFDHG